MSCPVFISCIVFFFIALSLIPPSPLYVQTKAWSVLLTSAKPSPFCIFLLKVLSYLVLSCRVLFSSLALCSSFLPCLSPPAPHPSLIPTNKSVKLNPYKREALAFLFILAKGLILSCLDLSCLVSSCLVLCSWSRHVLSCLVLNLCCLAFPCPWPIVLLPCLVLDLTLT